MTKVELKPEIEKSIKFLDGLNTFDSQLFYGFSIQGVPSKLSKKEKELLEEIKGQKVALYELVCEKEKESRVKDAKKHPEVKAFFKEIDKTYERLMSFSVN